MRFLVSMVTRELRASFSRLIFSFICVAIGVGAIVGLRAVVQAVRDGMTREARTLTGGDLVVQSSRPWSPETTRAVDEALQTAQASAQTETVDTTTLARPADAQKAVARTVELQAVDASWPIAGEVVIEGQPYRHALLRGFGILVRPELLAQLNVAVGDRLVIGEATFTIRGAILRESGRRAGFFSLGPRVVIDRDDLPATGLLRMGSRARYARMAAVPASALDVVTARLKQRLSEEFVTVRSYRTADDQVSEDLRRAEDYLSLVGLAVLVLGGIGVWSVTRVFLHQRTHSIAVLKCLGASTRQVLAVYVTQALVLATTGCIAGVIAAGVILRAIPASALEAFGIASTPALTVSAVAQGVGLGILVSLLFSLVPLLDVRHITPLALLRDDAALATAPAATTSRLRVDRVRLTAMVMLSASVLALVVWQAGSWRVGASVTAGFLAMTALLYAAAHLLIVAVAPLRRVRWFPLRHAVIGVGRPGNQTRTILLAVGIGVFFILGVRSLESHLLRAFRVDWRADGPDLFLVDIQIDQMRDVERLLASRNPGAHVTLVPTVRARVAGVEGTRVHLRSLADVRGQGSLAREYVMTYRAQPEANETVIDGRMGDGTGSSAEVSIEDSIRQRFGIDIGDRITFDVAGRRLAARVTSVRRVEWGDARAGGFMFVFAPGVLERAPQTAIAITRGPDEAAARARLQRDVAVAFPNVSAIDVKDVVERVGSVSRQVSLAVSLVGLVAVLSGLLILVGSVAMTRYERVREAALFKTLGATGSTVALTLATEYAALGTLAGLVGASGSLALSWVVCRYVLRIAWSPLLPFLAVGVVLTAMLVTVAGVAASLDVLRRKPLSVLRAD